jgi:hypothetical protein
VHDTHARGCICGTCTRTLKAVAWCVWVGWQYLGHRRTKTLKVGGGAEDVIARGAHAKIMTTPTVCQTTPIFARLRPLSQCNQEFFDEKANCKSSGIDLAAMSHFIHNQAWKKLRNLYCNNTGLENKGGLCPPS